MAKIIEFYVPTSFQKKVTPRLDSKKGKGYRVLRPGQEVRMMYVGCGHCSEHKQDRLVSWVRSGEQSMK
jgi:hypothetical protein